MWCEADQDLDVDAEIAGLTGESRSHGPGPVAIFAEVHDLAFTIIPSKSSTDVR